MQKRNVFRSIFLRIHFLEERTSHASNRHRVPACVSASHYLQYSWAVSHGSIIIHLTLCHRCSHHAVVGAIHSRDLSLAYLSIRSWRSRTVACPSGREWEFPLRSAIQLCRSIHFDELKNACFLSRRFRLYILPDRRNSNCSAFLKIFSKIFWDD